MTEVDSHGNETALPRVSADPGILLSMMPSEPSLGEARTSSPDWTSLRGAVLDGGYEVEDLLEADGDTASFSVRVLGDSSIRAAVLMIEAQGLRAAEQVALWESAKQLQHPNLNSPLAAGHTIVGGTNFVYVISRRPEERLGDVLPARPLSAKEAGDLLQSAARALQHLHSHGFVHGCVSPAQVFAMGDSIVLPTVGLRTAGSAPPLEWIAPKYTAPGDPTPNTTPAADVWCLGATIFEALTNKPCEWHSRDEAGRLPPPFNRILERCLEPDPDTRCKLPELQALYAAAIATAVAEKRTPPPLQSAPSITAERSRPERRSTLGEAQSRSARAWIYGLALIILVAVIWLARSRHPVQRAMLPKASEPVAQKGTATAKSESAWPTRTIAPDGTTATSVAPRPPVDRTAKLPRNETQAPPAQRTPANEPQTINGPIWRVVLYTYARSEEAENKARALNAKYAGLNAQTFSPNGPGGPFLVIAGGGMDHDAAVELRQKVRRMGLPRDSYIQNYKQ